jgi:hypothetical protein
MRKWFVLAVLAVAPVVMVLQVAWAWQESRPAGVGAEKRVFLRINRNQDAMGWVVNETDEAIIIRTPKGQNETYSKPRITRIIRLVDPAPGQGGVVYLADGQTREGTILEDHFDYVLMEIKGIKAKLRRQTVDHVVLQPTLEERYAQAKAALQPGNHETHLAICRWLYDQRRYDLARTELLDLLNQDEIPEARKLLNQVEAQIALAQPPPPEHGADPSSLPSSPASMPEIGPGGVEPGTGVPELEKKKSGPVYPMSILPSEIITREDVNIIRVYEIDFDPRHSSRITISPDTIRELIEKYGSSKLVPASQSGRNALFREDPMEIAHLMFDLRAREMYPQIQVNSEPYALNLFRQRVHDGWLVNNCGNTQCHGGLNAGAFFLHNRNSKDERVRYTNMLILERLKLDPEWPLVNYEHPDDSLIIQYGLPRDMARKPHPLVKDWKPVFTPSAPKLRDGTVEWISAMMQPRPEYPVKYEPPHLNRPKSDNDVSEDTHPPR